MDFIYDQLLKGWLPISGRNLIYNYTVAVKSAGSCCTRGRAWHSNGSPSQESLTHWRVTYYGCDRNRGVLAQFHNAVWVWSVDRLTRDANVMVAWKSKSTLKIVLVDSRGMFCVLKFQSNTPHVNCFFKNSLDVNCYLNYIKQQIIMIIMSPLIFILFFLFLAFVNGSFVTLVFWFL